MSDLKLNLNDFKAVLGVQNDGNVMVREGKLVKVNYGNMVTRFFRPNVVVDQQENAKMRKAFMTAIENSREGQLLQKDKINEIRRELGIKADDAEENTVRLKEKLTRHTINEILKKVLGNNPIDTVYSQLVERDMKTLCDRDICRNGDMRNALGIIKDNHVMQNAESMVAYAEKRTPAELFGFPKKDILKFIRNNAVQLKEMAFLRLCRYMHDARAKGLDPTEELKAENLGNMRTLFFSNLRDLMQVFAKHGEAPYTFEIVMAPPLGNAEHRNGVMTNKQLGSFETQLRAFDAVLDKMFPAKQPLKKNRPLPWNNLFDARTNENLKLAFREALLKALNESGGDAEQAMKSDLLKPYASLMKFTAQLDGNLTDGAITRLRQRFTRALCGIVRRGDKLDPSAALSAFSEVMKKVADALDPEIHLKKAFNGCNLTTAKYASLKAELMPEGKLTDQNLNALDMLVKKALDSVCQELEHPGLPAAVDVDVVRSLEKLSESFKAANERLSSNAVARKELIDNFCHDTNRQMFPACLNDDKHAVFRSKIYLVCEVLSEQERIDGGIPCSSHDGKTPRFTVLEKLGFSYMNYDSATEEKLGAENMKKIDEEVAAIEEKLDQLFKHVSTDEIKARQQYFKVKADASEGMFSKNVGRPLMLEAMRDGRVPDNVDEDAFGRFISMFYGDTQYGRMVKPCLYSLNIKSIETAKAEFEIRLAMVALIDRREGVVDTLKGMLKNGLEQIAKKNYTDPKQLTAAELDCYQTMIDKCGLHQQYTGFGSLDVAKVFSLLDACGIDIAKLKPNFVLDENGRPTPPDFDRALALMQLIKLRGGAIDGIVEWFERVSGKPISELSRVAVAELTRNGKEIVDPLTTLKESSEIGRAARFLKGEYSLAQAKLGANERIAIYKALNELVIHQDSGSMLLKTTEVSIGNVKVKLTIDPKFRKLVGHISSAGRDLPIAYPMDVADLRGQVQNEIIDHLNDYLDSEEGKRLLLGLLPDDKAFAANLSRAREICTRVISQITGKSAVDIASLTKEELQLTARGLIDGSVDPQSVQTPLLQSYNSREAIELGSSLLADRATLEKITWSETEEQLPPSAEREGKEPSPERIRDFAADLLMNRNTWIFDVQNSLPKGERILALLQGYAPEVRYLLANPGALEKVIVPSVKDSVVAILEQIRVQWPNLAEQGAIEALKFTDENTARGLAGIEDRIAGMLADTMDTLQTMISKLFDAQKGENKPTWQRTSSEINGAGGLDISTPQGKFMKDVLDRYFRESGAIDQRAMLSAFIRNTKPGDSDGKLAGELIKGAGPLLQKMLQGLPVETFGKETQAALEDTRCNLAPISPEVVNARLANMIVSSGGYISKIHVVASLGAASVAQTFLCRIYTKDHPKTGEEVVIKILRPNVETAVRREHQLISRIAAEQKNGVAGSFEGRYQGILKEFDLTIEAGNIDRGAVYDHAQIGDENSKEVLAMGRSHNVMPTTGALVLNKADGIPFSSYTRNARKRMNGILESTKSRVSLAPGEPGKTIYQVKDRLADLRFKRLELQLLHRDIVSERKRLELMVRAWFQQAFEGGFVHGDMHSGNIMTGMSGATIIDFGNCTFLDEAERNAVMVAFTGCIFGDAYYPKDPSWYLLRCLDTLSKAKGGAGLKNAKGDSVHVDAELKRDLKVVLSRGTKMDVVTRMLSSLTLIQNRGYPLPESISVFTQSLSRLQSAMSDVDELLGEIEEASEAIELDDELKDRYRNPTDPLTQDKVGFDLFRSLDQFLLGANGTPPKIDNEFEDKMFDGKNKPELLLKELERQNSELLHEDGGLKFIKLVLEKYDNLTFARISNYGSEFSVKMNCKVTDNFLYKELVEYRQLVSRGVIDDSKRDNLLLRLLSDIACFVSDYNGSKLVDLDYHSSTTSFEDCGYLSLESVLSHKMSGNENDIVKANNIFGASLGDMLSGPTFAYAISKFSSSYFNQVDLENATVGRVRRAFSDSARKDAFVSRRSRRLIDKVARDLLIPPGGITTDNLEEFVRINLEVLRKTVGREYLTSAELRYFVMIAESYGNIPTCGCTSSSYTSPFRKLVGWRDKDPDRNSREIVYKEFLGVQNRHLEDNGLTDHRQQYVEEPELPAA